MRVYCLGPWWRMVINKIRYRYTFLGHICILRPTLWLVQEAKSEFNAICKRKQYMNRNQLTLTANFLSISISKVEIFTIQVKNACGMVLFYCQKITDSRCVWFYPFFFSRISRTGKVHVFAEYFIIVQVSRYLTLLRFEKK